MDGRLRIEHGTFFDFLQLVLQDSRGEFEGRPAEPQASADLGPALSRPTKPVHAKQNVAHHYDLNGRLYDLFLDTTGNIPVPISRPPTRPWRLHKRPRNATSSQSSWSSRVRAFSISAPAGAGWR